MKEIIENIKLNSDKAIDSKINELWNISTYIHENPEMCFEEYKACDAQCTFLENNGFAVAKNIGTLDTAFCATLSFGTKLPVIAVLSEYDALTIGHACGHNLIATSALGAAIGIKNFLETNNYNGTIKIIGTPAEESGGGKIILLNNHVFDDVDSVIMMHPTSAPSRLAGECLSSKRISIEYTGKVAHAGAHPENGINALSAANLHLVATGMLRQHFKADIRLSQIIINSNNQTGLIPELSQIKGSLSCFKLNDLEKCADIIKNCAIGCGNAMGCKTEIIIEDGYQGRIPNKVLSDICKNELGKLNEPLLEGMPIDFGGEDLGNISRHIPICNPYITIFPEYKISNHTEQFKQLAISKAGLKCVEISSKSIARTCIQLFIDPSLIELAKNELKIRLKTE